jgi:MoxR-like ATPase
MQVAEDILSTVTDLINRVSSIFKEQKKEDDVAVFEWSNKGVHKNRIAWIESPKSLCMFRLNVGKNVFSVRLKAPSFESEKIDASFSIFKGDSYNLSDRLAEDKIQFSFSENGNGLYSLDKLAKLRSPKGIQDLEYLAQYWFPEGDLEGKNDIKTNNPNFEDANLKLNDKFIRYWPKYDREKNRWTVLVPELHDDDNGWAALFVCVAVRRLIISISNEPNKYGISSDDVFLKASSFVPTLPVYLRASEVKGKLKLTLPWQVIESACASLNSGKHVIFTGPPGCGKTELAKTLAVIAGGKQPIIATAAASWSTDELIGRYMPDISSNNNQSLRFSPGFFLRAIDEDRWLIIDELNRADIDACFGELFTVLSGQPAILPFEELIDGDSEGEAEAERSTRPIAILPAKYVGDESLKEEYSAHAVGARFRMIGTMNDADASRLSQLSYAFQRRFNIIRVDAPSPKEVQELIIHKIATNGKKDTLRSPYKVRVGKNRLDVYGSSHISVMNLLFANERGVDLVEKRVVGIAQVNDVIDFFMEGLSLPNTKLNATNQEDNDKNVLDVTAEERASVVHSYVALGVVMSVFPQLMALTRADQSNDLKVIVSCILDAFGENKFCRIEVKKERIDKDVSVRRSRSESTVERSHIVTEGQMIKDYLKEELRRLFRHTQLQPEVSELIESEPANG